LDSCSAKLTLSVDLPIKLLVYFIILHAEVVYGQKPALLPYANCVIA